ncbi:MAG: DUF3311 domain-containing protein [Bacillota bacterium]|nr:DUF3311 domain-containing protein [Bacillota bacterium]MDP4169702.1 DUF3311 domain-containing protein [Bacillota bacterium]
MKIQHLFALIPFIGLLGGISFANKVTPYVAGMPFLLFYIVMWVVLTSVIMFVIYKIDPVNRKEEM